MLILNRSRLFVLAIILVSCVAWLFENYHISPRVFLDAIYVRLHSDPALATHYDWPAELQFDAPLELPHINNYPAFTRIGVRGSVHWNNDVLTIHLQEVSHAAESSVWFDCKALREMRVGITRMEFFGEGYAIDEPPGNWSAWQPVVATRSGQGAYRAQGNWVYTIPAPLAGKPWEQRLAFQTRCTVRDGSMFSLMSFTSAWFLANAAHQQTYAGDPCSQIMSLRDALAARCLKR